MSIEDVAERADVWSESIKKIIKAVTAAVVALIAAISGLTMVWSGDDSKEPVNVETNFVGGGATFGPQCSQLMSTIEHTWTEQQWSVWEKLKKDMDC